MRRRHKNLDNDIVILKGDKPSSMRLVEDPFAGQYGSGLLEPPYDLEFLARLPEYSNVLSQCVEAMVTNIDGFGFTLDPIGNADPENDGIPTKEAENERKSILHFFEFCNQDLPYSQLRRRVRRDLETLGNAYWEIIRDGKGDIAWIEHIEGHTMRLTKLDDEYTPVTMMIRDDASNKLQPYQTQKRFRRFVQIRNQAKVYFKEFGDPRIINARTGEVQGEIDTDDFIPATEIIHFKLYCPYSPYGVPRWIGNLLAVQGSRQAEEVNYEYFENNTIPPLALLVAGKLSDKTVNVLEDFVNDHMRGRKGFNKMLIIQANPAGIAASNSKTPPVALHFEHLGDTQHGDSLFNTYDAVNREKIRSAFRLPPIFVGLTDEYTR
ncbi:MAG: phage portal protein, partial [Synergistaceae bacterium]|nr:phage portal protein [Synergistaceae bacterium]